MKNSSSFLRRHTLAIATAACLMSASAFAATVTVPDATVPVEGGATTPTPMAVTFQGDGVTVGYQCDISFPTAELDATVAGSGTGLCSVNDGAGTITIVDGTVNNSALGNTTSCNVTFTAVGPGTDGDVYPLTLGGCIFSDASAAEVPGPHTLNNGSITVQAAPPDADLVFTPPSGGTVTFPTGTQNDTVTASIGVTATGTSGTGTVDNCVFSGANAGAFSVSGTPISVGIGGSDSIDLECVLDDAAQSATLTCDTSDVDGAGTASWTMSCPAGTAVPSPDFSSAPPAGSAIACNGAPGSTVNRSIEISNTGNPGAGSDLAYTCTSDSASFVITGGASDTLAVGESATLAFTCQVPAAEGDPDNTGTISCTSNGGDAAYPVSAGVVTTPPANPAPSIIPANSLWSLLALFGVMAGIGAVVVGLRRS